MRMPEQKNQGEGNWESAKAYERDRHKFSRKGKAGDAAAQQRSPPERLVHPCQNLPARWNFSNCLTTRGNRPAAFAAVKPSTRPTA